METERQEDLQEYQCHTPESANLERHQHHTSNCVDLQRRQWRTREAGDLQRRLCVTPEAEDLQPRQCHTPEAGDLRGKAEKEGTWGHKCWTFLKTCTHSSRMKLVLGLLLGQFLSILLCGTGVTTQLLFSKYSVEVPTTQAFINYILLATVYGTPVVVRKDFCTTLQRNWWKYLFLGLVDAEANYLIIKAYKYTNLTTVQLLDSFAIAMVMVLSCIFLRTRYKIINFMGVSLSLIGILSLVLADIQGSRSGRGPNPLLGDILCLAGVVLYAISNVAQEFLVRHHSITEYLGFIGVTGSIITAVQVIVLERSHLARVDWNQGIVLLLLGFGVSQFLFYSITPHLLRLASAVVLNLSLLTSDFYSLLFGLFLFYYKFSFFYVLAFVLIILGIFIYNIRLPMRAIKEQSQEQRAELQGKQATEENISKGENTQRRKRRSEGLIISGLRGLLESQTYEMSVSEEFNSRKTYNSSKSNKRVNRLASKLGDQLPEKWTHPSHRKNIRHGSEGPFEDKLEVKELVGGEAKMGQARGHSSSTRSTRSDESSCSHYGSVDQHSNKSMP